MNDFFDNKTYLVTGASSGIGRATARNLLQAGASVILVSRNLQGMKETTGTLNSSQTLCLACDLAKLNAIAECVQQAMEWKNAIDGVVYCAGVGGRARLRDTSFEFLYDRMNVNCFAFVELVRIIVKLKKKLDSLRVVAISSLAALGHHRYLTAYSASKAALEAAAKTMSVELYKRNTRINLVRPAYVDTPMIEDPLDNVKELIKEEYQPLGIIAPEEVANLILFLLGPASNKINGAIFELNAGAFD